ncbi:MAG: SDR family NAD(P)-dependent oxidoreductase [Dehalococcoidia bacterium]|nr:SDR family NAD(P)-dependent oxidoreductase [Dehalococcoidia bacterium]
MGALDGKVAVVTGSGQGLGRDIAIGLAKEGAKLVTNNRKPGTEGGDAETTAKTIKEAGGEAVPVFADMAVFQDCERLIKTAVEKFGRIDILVNNAGVDRAKMVWNMAEEDWDFLLDVILKGAFSCTRFATGYMREQKWGRIINVTSDAYRGTVGHVNYGASKAGLVGLTRATALEVGRYSITCNAIAPTAKTRMSWSPEVEAGLRKRVETGVWTQAQFDEYLTMGGPEYIAPFIVYLASEASANISGRVFNVTGGKIALYSEPEEIKSIFKKEGVWTQQELVDLIPKTIALGLANPAPPPK